jgi:hypothetical protein
MPDLPFILAGPILRRVTPQTVSVWVALSRSAFVILRIWDKEINTGPGSDLFSTDDPALFVNHSEAKRFGDNLFIAVVTIDSSLLTPPSSLVPGKLYSYDLAFTGVDITITLSDLKSNNLLQEGKGNHLYDKLHDDQKAKFEAPVRLALGYKDGFLPTFVVPPIGIDNINLVHGSCRNANGYGRDCLAALDYVIKDAVINNQIEKRPHQLYLTGDQIYADVSPVLMLPVLTQLGNDLLGITETIKVKRKKKVNNNEQDVEEDIEVTQNNFPVFRREELVQSKANFTCRADIHDFKINHLLSFGEFAATYIMYWNNAAWPVELFAKEEDLKKYENYLEVWDTDPATVDIIDAFKPIPSIPPEKNAELKDNYKKDAKEKAKKQYEDELPHFIEFRNMLPLVTRILANVPVFMIMDDHEVTDDWYITKAWKNAVLSSSVGVNILRNALMAYSLFQDWGNDPPSYNDPGNNKSKLLDKIQSLFPADTAAGPVAAFANEIDKLFGFDLQDETPPPLKWHYSVPCGEISVHVFDTRTRRTYETLNASPGLLSDTAMDDQIPISLQPEKLIVFVSPAPVLGLAVIEELLQPAASFFDAFSDDPEPWAFCSTAFEKLLSRLQKFKRVVLLSGDIHFGITTDLEYWKKGEDKSSRIIQLVSSALKNEKFAEDQFLLAGNTQNLLGSLFYPLERLGWNSGIGLSVTNPSNQVNPPKLRIRLRKEPVLLPSQGWPAGSKVTRGAVEELPDWAWRLKILEDSRPDDESEDARPEAVRVKPLSPDIDPLTTDWTEPYNTIVQRHYDVTKKSVARKVVFDCNIGLINFKTDADNKVSVKHSFLYWLVEDDKPDDLPRSYTVYTNTLEPTGEPQPLISPAII